MAAPFALTESRPAPRWQVGVVTAALLAVVR